MSKKAEKELKKAFREPRPLEEIQKEYNNICATVGDRAYRAELLKKEIEELHAKQWELNQESNAAVAKQKAAEAQKVSDEKNELS